MKKNMFFPGLLFALLLTVFSLHSQATTFTDQSAFLSSLVEPPGVLSFDSLTGGSILSGTHQSVLTESGQPLTTITFAPSVTDYMGLAHQLLVVANENGSNPTTSGFNSLGVSDPGNFNTIIGGTNIPFELSSQVNAFGLFVITPDQLFNDDIHLVAGGNTASLLADDRSLVGNFGGVDFYVYFLGIIENKGFSSASIEYGPNVSGGPFLFNIDDILVSAVPEPSILVLFLNSVPALLIWRKRRRASPD